MCAPEDYAEHFRCLQLHAQLALFGQPGTRDKDGWQGRWLTVHDLDQQPLLVEKPLPDGGIGYALLTDKWRVGPFACPGRAYTAWQEDDL